MKSMGHVWCLRALPPEPKSTQASNFIGNPQRRSSTLRPQSARGAQHGAQGGTRRGTERRPPHLRIRPSPLRWSGPMTPAKAPLSCLDRRPGGFLCRRRIPGRAASVRPPAAHGADPLAAQLDGKPFGSCRAFRHARCHLGCGSPHAARPCTRPDLDPTRPINYSTGGCAGVV